MPIRKLMPLGIFLSMLGFSSVATPWAYRSLFPLITPAITLRELSELLSRSEPELFVVPFIPNRPASGVWVCERPQSWEQLSRLRRTSEDASRWQGVVYCERVGELTEFIDTDTWGEHGMQIGALLFFGDPTLLGRIQKAILDHQAET
jgi:hypothetical protein